VSQPIALLRRIHVFLVVLLVVVGFVVYKDVRLVPLEARVKIVVRALKA
jgi:hypothetical protein